MITLTNEDCMELMARYPDKAFDLAIVDPPYGGGGTQRTMHATRGRFAKYDLPPPQRFGKRFDKYRRFL